MKRQGYKPGGKGESLARDERKRRIKKRSAQQQKKKKTTTKKKKKAWDRLGGLLGTEGGRKRERVCLGTGRTGAPISFSLLARPREHRYEALPKRNTTRAYNALAARQRETEAWELSPLYR